MKPRIGYLFWILMLAFGLMILIAVAQLLTKQNINGLKKSNREAAITFTINNRLQDLVNLSFELETKVTNPVNKITNRQSIVDSLTMLGYNASVLDQVNMNEEVNAGFTKLNKFINYQIESSLRALQLTGVASLQTVDSLRKLQIADSVYSIALSIQKYLERDLQSVFNNNTTVSEGLSAYNRVLAIVAIAAVLILGTIIINRHLRQVQLISELETATTEAKKLAIVKDQFLANMSHEIRTPLNAIKGFGDLLLETPLNNEQQQYAAIIKDSSKNLLHIVNDILDISKIEAGKLRIESKEFNLERILQAIDYIFFNEAAEKKVQYSWKINADVPLQIKGDPDRLSQVLINLVGNGIKFTQQGYVITTVSVNGDEKDKIWIAFEVKDSGIGIPSDKQEEIFQRFEQLITDSKPITQGTGLGLSIVKNLANMMGGNISVESKLGKGSLFKVLLPFEKVTSLSLPRKSDMNGNAARRKYNGTSALVVDDNKVNQLLVKQMLGGLDVVSDFAINGEEALDILGKKSFDIIFMDIQMPQMDGYKTIAAIRNEKKIDTPVVAMTAFAMPGEKEKCITAGMDDYLSKPLEYTQIINVLEKFIHLDEGKKTTMAGVAKRNISFLLQLSGGDKSMAKKILTEIKNEIPGTISKLRLVQAEKKYPMLESIYHYMLSTFAPIGNDTAVMLKLEQLRNSKQNVDNGEIQDKVIDELINEVTAFDKLVENAIETIK
jgi:signal transduction histidine kinase/DNA-binding NarL/FixJ family response regulator